MLVTGSAGFIGSALVSFLADQGHDVTRLVRVRPTSGDRQVHWDPEAGTIDADRLAGTEAAVHLAGENLAAKRWTAGQKARIRDSRAKGTRLLGETLARLDPPPTVLACASAKDYYGGRGDEVLVEESAPGSGFLSEVIQQWEAATVPAAHAGIRVVNLRIGMVLGAKGGLLARMLTPFKLGVGGRMGSGKQYMSWISLQDVVRAIHITLTTPTLDPHHTDSGARPLTSCAASGARFRAACYLWGGGQALACQHAHGARQAPDRRVRVPPSEAGRRPQSGAWKIMRPIGLTSRPADRYDFHEV